MAAVFQSARSFTICLHIKHVSLPVHSHLLETRLDIGNVLMYIIGCGLVSDC